MSHLWVNRALTSMDILGNNIGTEQAQKLIEILDTSTTLTTLCGFTGEEEELDLSNRSLSASCAVLVANEIRVNRALTSVDLSNSKLTRGKARYGESSDPNNDSHWETDMSGLIALSESLPKCP